MEALPLKRKRAPEAVYIPPPRPPQPPRPPVANEIFVIEPGPAPLQQSDFEELVAAIGRRGEITNRKVAGIGEIREIEAADARAYEAGSSSGRRASATSLADPSQPLPDSLAAPRQFDRSERHAALKREVRAAEEAEEAAERLIEQLTRKLSPAAIGHAREWQLQNIREMVALSLELAARWQADADLYNAIGEAGWQSGSLLDGRGPARPGFAYPERVAEWMSELLSRGLIEPTEQHQRAAKMHSIVFQF